ncbi:hypothetical protein M3193_08250 [Sporosarcina luteola]|uniref:hypothetical protein n=1 Tax=Sporosarcina luteola TaxID=582850 RepID=UPI00203EE9E8|nr:hypothetical protein [Sporosarcina luteola]MCM3744131.1 hypothetical protein [Sporosarcina luteola]
MANQHNGKNQQNDKSVAEGIKNTAGSALETTGIIIAMYTVDAAKNAAKKVTGKMKNNQGNQ